MRFYRGILVVGLLSATVGTTPAFAQTASRLGPSTPVIPTYARGSNVAYDYKNGLYLVVGAYGALNGVFVTVDGAVGSAFAINGPFSHFPSVAYSPDLNGGAGGFLVTWHLSVGNGAMVHGKVVTSTGVVGPDITISAGGSWWEAAADVAYSTTSHEFLVVWQGIGIVGQRVGLNGELLGANFPINPPVHGRDPAVAYNPNNNEFMVSFGDIDAASDFAAAQRIQAGTGALVGAEIIVGRALQVYITEISFNPSTNQYLVAWYQGGTYGRLLDASGNAASGIVLVGISVSAYDALGIAYNTSSGSFMMVSHLGSSFQDGSVELNGTTAAPDVAIVATSVAATKGNFYPKVASAVGRSEWLMSTATDFVATTVQRLQSTRTAGGGPPPPARSTRGDFDGDGRADIGIWRPSTGEWWLRSSAGGFASYGPYGWGSGGDIPVAGDYDGDRRSDVAVYRPSDGTWYILKSSSNFATRVTYAWGSNTDVPVPGDYDGDGRTDIAVYRPSTGVWYILKSSANFTTYGVIGWGASGDVPVPGDYDGDGKTDLAIYRPSVGAWYILNSSTNFTSFTGYNWGAGTDVPVPADYDGDGRTDIAVYRLSTGVWYISKSSTNFTTGAGYAWGVGSDVPTPGDYDGDGKADIAIYRPGTGQWYILNSSSNFTTYVTYDWGTTGDVPILRRP